MASALRSGSAHIHKTPACPRSLSPPHRLDSFVSSAQEAVHLIASVWCLWAHNNCFRVEALTWEREAGREGGCSPVGNSTRGGSEADQDVFINRLPALRFTLLHQEFMAVWTLRLSSEISLLPPGSFNLREGRFRFPLNYVIISQDAVWHGSE